MPGQPVDQAGQRALAQVHGLGQVLGAELAPLALGEPLQDLEVTDPSPCRSPSSRSSAAQAAAWQAAISRQAVTTLSSAVTSPPSPHVLRRAHGEA